MHAVETVNGHSHIFLGNDHERNERKVWWVIALTSAMMFVEIIGGEIYGSMALVADGWHMSTHAGAMLIAALAYRFARQRADDTRFTFGTGKVGDLAGFSSAIVLALISLFIGWESITRLVNPTQINFMSAIGVAIAGLFVNIACAWLLRDDHHHHGHEGHHHHHGEHEHHDNNFRAAYIHVIADALTSILAIAALSVGGCYGWLWADPLMGIVGAIVIAHWSWGLIKDSGGVLLDAAPQQTHLEHNIREVMAPLCLSIDDLHVWQVGPGHFAAIVAVQASTEYTPAFYKAKLNHIHELSHLSVEIQHPASRSTMTF